MSKTVRAIIKNPHEFKAVQVRPSGAGFELLAHADHESGLPAGDTTIIGFDSSRAAFYRIKVPPVKDEQMHNLVRMQAETLLPLPLEQMELTWRQGKTEEGKVSVTIAAARSIQLERFFRDVQDYQPNSMFLDCEGVVQAWREFYGGGNQSAVIIYLGASNTHVCQVQSGVLSHAVSLDQGRGDLIGPQADHTSLQRFSYDLHHTLQLFELDEKEPIPVYMLCPDLQSFQNLTAHLSHTEMNIQAALPNRDHITTSVSLSSQTFYEYLIPLGLALMALAPDRNELKLFRRILPDKADQPKGIPLPSVKMSALLAAVMLAVFSGLFYWHMLILEGNFSNTNSDIDLMAVTREQHIKKSVARERIDLLELIDMISACAPRGVQLDKFIYQRGRPITVDAQTNRQELIYTFRAELLKQPLFKSVIIQNQNPDTRGNRTNFTVKFEYAATPKIGN